jgi:RNA polymerase-binding transcription factor
MSAKLKTDRTEGREMLRELLTRLRNEAQQRIKDLRKDQEQESDSEPADEMDSANTTEEIETHAGLIARAEEKLRYLDEAFTRLDAGKYGLCLKCSGAIPIERLMAIPFASYCVDCQQELHRARGGWGEGTTIAPFDHQWTLPQEMEAPTEREYQTTDPEEQLTIYPREPLALGEPEKQATRQSSRNKRTSRRKR